jgi:hypothetical protein
MAARSPEHHLSGTKGGGQYLTPEANAEYGQTRVGNPLDKVVFGMDKAQVLIGAVWASAKKNTCIIVKRFGKF